MSANRNAHFGRGVTVTLANFKSYRTSVSARLSRNWCSVLIGANGAGKSNFLDGLRIMQWLVAGHPLAELQRTLPLGVRGDARGLFADLDTPMQLLCSHPDLGSVAISLRYEGGQIVLVEEQMRGGSGTTYSMTRDEGSFITDQHGQRFPVQMSPTKIGVSQLAEGAVWETARRDAQRWQDVFRAMQVLDIQPSAMRDYAIVGDTTLVPDGANISSVLHSVMQRTPALLETFVLDVLGWSTGAITSIKTSRNEVMLQLTEPFGTVCDAVSLSSGQLRILAIGVALCSAPVGSMIVVDEVDTGIADASRLFSAMMVIAMERQLHVLFTTHGSALLDMIPLPHVQDVLVCFRGREDRSRCLWRLGDMPDFVRFMAAGGTLGNVFRLGLIQYPDDSSEGWGGVANAARLGLI